jgi:hypothetical protein
MHSLTSTLKVGKRAMPTQGFGELCHPNLKLGNVCRPVAPANIYSESFYFRYSFSYNVISHNLFIPFKVILTLPLYPYPFKL